MLQMLGQSRGFILTQGLWSIIIMSSCLRAPFVKLRPEVSNLKYHSLCVQP